MKVTAIRIQLRLQQPWAIGRSDVYGEVDQEIQQAVVTDAEGNPIVPGPSLVGSLRHHLGEQAEEWLGREAVDDKGKKTDPTPSPLRCLAPLVTEANVGKLTTTKIDRHRRAAEGGTLRTQQLANPGARIVWWLLWEPKVHADERLAALIASLRNFHPTIGRGRTSGRGRAFGETVHWRVLDLATADDLTWWLQDRHAELAPGAAVPDGPGWKTRGADDYEEPSAAWQVTFTCVDPLFIGSGNKSTERDNLMTTADTIPTTTWKGIFRHRVSHILAVTGAPDAEAVLERLFGSGRGKDENEGKRGRLYFEPSKIEGDLERKEGVTKVAIDRVTGGAYYDSQENPQDAAGALYSIRAYRPDSTVTLRIQEWGRIEESDKRLIDQVITDIDDGLVAIGGFGTRGFGTLRKATS